MYKSRIREGYVFENSEKIEYSGVAKRSQCAGTFTFHANPSSLCSCTAQGHVFQLVNILSGL